MAYLEPVSGSLQKPTEGLLAMALSETNSMFKTSRERCLNKRLQGSAYLYWDESFFPHVGVLALPLS